MRGLFFSEHHLLGEFNLYPEFQQDRIGLKVITPEGKLGAIVFELTHSDDEMKIFDCGKLPEEHVRKIQDGLKNFEAQE